MAAYRLDHLGNTKQMRVVNRDNQQTVRGSEDRKLSVEEKVQLRLIFMRPGHTFSRHDDHFFGYWRQERR